jgi:hypothetical protein
MVGQGSKIQTLANLQMIRINLLQSGRVRLEENCDSLCFA